ncbi:ABC transporter ATP-binding protein [uncultured Ruegeria sp.]|uniref:ABC transporter ATP-binding protein n=1 Tax=uncultured Ruegeria sp. TaxID=259304 RepID=UPI00262688DE|nr:ABC transporter ATP-binding protein [uncultured Ruegeria sp.]
MLDLNDITKTFGGVHAVQDVTMSVSSGEVRGLIGPNGAGKTTLVNLISGLLAHSAGSLSLDGEPLDRLRAHQRAALGVARTFQNLRVFPSLSVAQNIDVARYSGRGSAMVEAAIPEFGLSDKLNKSAGSLAYGQLRRLEIVRALALNPRVLMLDEPAAGMNEQETDALGRSLSWVRSHSDCAILVIDHDLKFIMSLCDRITVLNMGTVIAEGAPEDITKNQEVIDAYLGETDERAA